MDGEAYRGRASPSWWKVCHFRGACWLACLARSSTTPSSSWSTPGSTAHLSRFHFLSIKNIRLRYVIALSTTCLTCTETSFFSLVFCSHLSLCVSPDSLWVLLSNYNASVQLRLREIFFFMFWYWRQGTSKNYLRCPGLTFDGLSADWLKQVNFFRLNHVLAFSNTRKCDEILNEFTLHMPLLAEVYNLSILRHVYSLTA